MNTMDRDRDDVGDKGVTEIEAETKRNRVTNRDRYVFRNREKEREVEIEIIAIIERGK